MRHFRLNRHFCLYISSLVRKQEKKKHYSSSQLIWSNIITEIFFKRSTWYFLIVKTIGNRFYTLEHEIQLVNHLFILLSSSIIIVFKSSFFSISGFKNFQFAIVFIRISTHERLNFKGGFYVHGYPWALT